ncbi:hypothetical protein MRB53_004900 [Persea americana]|uniref:Uncharacterized protein n=1 Tax=Persea americana TaxID=3435 RepID=A0ACC2MBH7_PERAE|nr:hypothetical protein MRB53_004900 [Persea americana]|eukprot:TRINITY_DN28222_c0_g1_i1.p1 TRINITY_DN28222_c0_g1~~TRINITY_DN28222_c0_g1_i1.p1  ORF type:complete len:268 (-),score=64.10 TRINITY_DN28222_c0_g1_i1:514-1197(-)
MAATFFALTNTFFPPLHSSSSLSLPKTTLLTFFKHNSKRPNSSPVLLCKAAFDPSRRQSLAIYFSAFVLSLPGKGLFSDSNANAAILEADDDEELLEKVKKDRKKRIQRQEVINSSKKETGYLQELVYKLSKVGQAIEKNDLSAASSVLGPNTNSEWVQNVNRAFTKLSTSPEEKIEVATFNASLASLISSVTKKDIESSKMAFITSAGALEKWTALTGFDGQLKGL